MSMMSGFITESVLRTVLTAFAFDSNDIQQAIAWAKERRSANLGTQIKISYFKAQDKFIIDIG